VESPDLCNRSGNLTTSCSDDSGPMASRRIAANLKLIVEGAYRCCSSAIRYRETSIARLRPCLKASLGSEQYQSINSRVACS